MQADLDASALDDGAEEREVVDQLHLRKRRQRVLPSANNRSEGDLGFIFYGHDFGFPE